MSGLADLVLSHGANKPPTYLPTYEEFFGPHRGCSVRLLELGIATGASLRVWRDYFPQGEVTGIDWELPEMDGERVAMYAGEQDDWDLLGKVGEERGPFDIIIDDCAHVGAVASSSFSCLFEEALRPGGLYCVEDWGTGYWPDWEDGVAWEPGHTAGMVGFVKGLVDTCGRYFMATSNIERVVITAGLAIVVKAP